MASVIEEVLLAAPVETVWAALREVGAVHRLFPGVLADCVLEGDVRTVRFLDGLVAHERIVALDDARRRVVYTALREGIEHHSASMQVLPEGEERCRFLWVTDVLPDALAGLIAPRMRQGTAALQRLWTEGGPRDR